MATNLRTNWLIAIALTGWVLYLLAPILTPFVAAALFAYVGDPLADRLERRMPRSLAVVVVFLLTFSVVALLVVLVGPLIRQQVGALMAVLPELANQLEQVWLPNVTEFLGIELGDDIGIGAFLSSYGEMAGEWGGKVLAGVSKGGSAVMTGVISLFLIPVLTFYMLRDWDEIMLRLGSLVPASQQETIFSLAKETDEVLGAFLRGQLLVMFALAFLYSVGLAISGVPFALAIGVVSGIVSFVPYLGLIFGIALASLTVLLQPDPLWPLAGVVATFTIAQLLEGTVLTPKLVGDRVGLHPVVVIFAVAAGGQLFGFFGVLLALPAASVLSVLVRFAYERYLKEHPEIASRLEAAQESDPVEE